MDKKLLNEALLNIFKGIEQLREAFPEKKFTVDGRLVGDIGEAIAQRDYDLELYKKLQKGYDATSNGNKVQIKATFKDQLTFKEVPDFYLGLKLYSDGNYEEIYNGPGRYIKEKYGHRKGVGKELLSFPISILKSISDKIPISEKISSRKSNL
jgi:hypothetical protein